MLCGTLCINVNGPDDDVARYTVETDVPSVTLHCTRIEVADWTVAVTPVGVPGGVGSVVALTGGADCADVPIAFDADIS